MKKKGFRLFNLIIVFLFTVGAAGQPALAAKGKPPAPKTELTLSTPDIAPTVNVGDVYPIKVSLKYSNKDNLSFQPQNLTVTKDKYQSGKFVSEEYTFQAPDTPAESVVATVTVTELSTGKKATFTATFRVVDPTPDPDPDPTPEPKKYLALGDSIPYGRYYTSSWNYLMGGTDTNSYVEQLASYLNIQSGNFTDASASGDTTKQLYDRLPDLLESIKAADYISICIGGNDIMGAAARNLSGIQKYNVDEAKLILGQESFEKYWPQIIDYIETWNSDVTLIVMTIYNPYHTNDTYNGVNYDALLEKYYSTRTGDAPGLNYLIKDFMTIDDSGAYWTTNLVDNSFQYLVADVYQAFNDSSNKDSLTGFYRSFCDPHPNQTGHNLIFTTHQEELAAAN